MDLIVIYKFSVLSAVSEKTRKVTFQHEHFCLQLAGSFRKKTCRRVVKHIVR